MLTCPTCEARNADSAWWCTQCYASLAPSRSAASSEPDPVSPVAAGGSVPTAVDPDAADAAEDAGDVGAVRDQHDASDAGRDIRQRAGEVEWRCGSCDSWQPLGRSHCATCGTAPAGFGYQPRTSRRRISAATALAAAIVLPGLGHLLLGAVGAGAARLVLWAVWLGGGVGLLLEPASRGVGGVLVVGAVALWLASIVGVVRLAAGEPDPVGTRTLAVGVGAVTLLVVLLALVATFGGL